MHFNLISRDNGGGLTQDMNLLEAFLNEYGHVVTRVEYDQQSLPADVNIYLELFHERHLSSATRHVGIFNLEFFEYSWIPFLPAFTQLWAKSQVAHDWYTSQKLPSIFTGFLSRNLYDAQVEREVRVLHLRGQSWLKGTDAVLDAWAQAHERLPPLTVALVPPEGEIINDPEPVSCAIPNVEVLSGRLSEARLIREMNRHLIHLCPSEIEGWGHYIAEGLSCGACVVTTDASPMNEHVSGDYGFLLPVARSETKRLITQHFVTPTTIVNRVAWADVLVRLADKRKEISAASRQARSIRQGEFRLKAHAALQLLDA